MTTGFKREFCVRALDVNGDWFEHLDGSKVAGRDLVIVDAVPVDLERHKKPSISNEELPTS